MSHVIPLETLGVVGKVPTTQILFNVHRYVLKNFIYLKESIQYPEEVQHIWDIWRRAFVNEGLTLVGDCEDFAMHIIYILYLCGVPKTDLYLATCHAPTGEGHGVMLIMIEETPWQCDNMLDNPVPAFWLYHSCGYFVSAYSNSIMRLDDLQWKKFQPSKLNKPDFLQTTAIEFPQKSFKI